MVHKKLPASACRGCCYWLPVYLSGKFARNASSRLHACHFCLINEHSRGCPPGAECTRRAQPLRRG